ncbi:MAG: tetratricopeptide repeat protein [Candidatus Polarisedimenticolia bacterium]
MPEPSTVPSPSPSLHGYSTPPVLAEVIRDLYLDERSGTLVVGRSGVEKRLLLDRGMILSASSSLPEEHLTALLLERGLIRTEEAEALKGLGERQAIEVLLSRGVLTAEALNAANRDLAQQILTGLFRWEEVEYRFEEAPIPPGALQTDVVRSFELIIRALRSMSGFEPIQEALLRQDRALRFSDQMYLPFDQLSLTPLEGFLVSRIDGQTKLRDILAQTPSSEEEAACRFLFGLLILGLASFVPAIASGALSCQDLLKGEEEKRRREDRERKEILEMYALATAGNPAAVLGLGEVPSADQVKAAYLERKERYQPARFLKKVQTDLREELQIVEARLLEAFLALRSEKLGAARVSGTGTERLVSLDLEALSMRKELTKTEKQSMEEERARMAEQFFSKARDYFKIGDFFNCIRYCEFSSSYNDKSAGVWSLMGQGLMRNPDYRWQKRAENAFARAAELEPFNPGHSLLLGAFYRAHDMHSKARREFEKVLSLVPNHPEALLAVKELARH